MQKKSESANCLRVLENTLIPGMWALWPCTPYPDRCAGVPGLHSTSKSWRHHQSSCRKLERPHCVALVKCHSLFWKADYSKINLRCIFIFWYTSTHWQNQRGLKLTWKVIYNGKLPPYFFLSNLYLKHDILCTCMSFAWTCSSCKEHKASEKYKMKNSWTRWDSNPMPSDFSFCYSRFRSLQLEEAHANEINHDIHLANTLC